MLSLLGGLLLLYGSGRMVGWLIQHHAEPGPVPPEPGLPKPATVHRCRYRRAA